MNIIILPTAYPNVYNQNSSIFVEDQAKALSKNGVSVNVMGAIPISFKDIWKRKIFKFGNFKSEKNGINTHLFLFPSLPKLKKFNQFIQYYLNKLIIKRYLKNNTTDLIHVHNATVGKAALWIKKNYQIPYCVTEHSTAYARNLFNQEQIIAYKIIYKNSFYNIAVSHEFTQLLYGIYNMAFYFIPNVINTDYFIPKTKIDTEFKFINIGYLDEKKNQLLLINAFYQAFKNNKSVHLSILGEGIEYNKLQREIDKLKMNNQIKLFGVATRNQVLNELQKSDAFVLSSKYETFGVVLIEAMSCGLPIVSTKCGGPESIIQNNYLGVLVENNNISQLEKGMKIIYNNKEKYNGDMIREYVINHFSEDVIARKLIEVYKKVL